MNLKFNLNKSWELPMAIGAIITFLLLAITLRIADWIGKSMDIANIELLLSAWLWLYIFSVMAFVLGLGLEAAKKKYMGFE